MRGGGDAVGDGGAAAVIECGDRISGAEKPCLVAGNNGYANESTDQSLLAIVVSAGDSVDCEEEGCVESPQKSHLSRNSSSHEQCRVCQQEKEEDLIELGCHCRGGLAKSHRTCIDTWFSTRGSNKCEICQQVAANVATPEPNAPTSYWVWRVDPSFRGTIEPERNRGCFSPLWVAFSILVGGLLLDLLISLTLGVSALPVNIIIGVIVVLGLGTAFRLALEFCHDWSVRRVVHRVEANVSLGFHPAL